MIRCVIIDDEPLAREGLVSYINEVSFLMLVGQGSNPLELNEILTQQKVDLVFLDIQMPVINGIDFLKITKELPMIVITTAYPSFALESFDLDVLDYLLKPITFNRFLKAANKSKKLKQLRDSHTDEGHSISETDYFFVKSDGKYEKIFHHTILYVQGLQNYVTFYTTRGKHVSLMTLKNVAQKLSQNGFLRVHKSYLVAIDKIERIEPHEITIGEHTIPISRNYRKIAKSRILGDHLWKNDH
ncbi:MAG: LytTR family DNA-binding domain-containing protein [Bacteroidota bacterium]